MVTTSLTGNYAASADSLWRKRSWLASFLLTANISGFAIVSYLPGLLRIDSRVATVPFRAITLAIMIYSIYKLLAIGHLHLAANTTTLIAGFFWLAYSLRYIVDAGFLQVPLGQPPGDIGLYLFGITLPTFLAFYVIKDVGLYRRALPWTMIALIVCCLLSIGGTGSTTSKAATHGNAANDVMTHVAYGHMGLTTMILGFFALLRVGGTRYSRTLRLLAIAGIVLGAYTILVASSRGAFVAALLVIPVVLLLAMRSGSKILTLAVIVALALLLVATITFLSRRDLDVTRLMSTAVYSTSNDSIFVRENLLREAWQEYIHNPWLGSSLVERNWLLYPHNMILESFMATGTFGGTAFTLMMLIAAYRAFLLLKRDKEMAWISLCFFQQLIGAMFSGGIYVNYSLFCFMSIVLGVDLSKNQYK